MECLPVDVLHDVSRPGQLYPELTPVLHEEVHESAGDRGGGVEEKGGNPEDGPVQLLQAQEEVVPVLDGEKVVVVLLQDAGVEGGQVGPPPHILTEDLGWCEVTAEDEVVFVDSGTTPAARQDPAVSHNGAGVVSLIEDGGGVRKQR